MDNSLSELMQVCTACKDHKLSEDSYTAPGFIDFLDTALNVDDIPMQSHTIENKADIAKNPSNVPWENSIKNFVLDLVSIQDTRTFSTCIILTEFGYAYAEATVTLITKKCTNSSTAVVYVVPLDDNNNDFGITIRRNTKIEYQTTTDREYLVSTVSIWYMPDSSIIFCHDTSIDEYKQVVSMMPQSTWSIYCSPTNFIDNICTYICPVYSYPGSMETRAVGSGPVNFAGCKVKNSYPGKMNYYSRCIRGSRHSSGRCYDCQILYVLLTSLQYDSSKEKPLPTVEFASSFLNSVSSKQKVT